MEKWHINKKGLASICKADKGNCPFGNESEHYTTKDEAMNASQDKMSKEFGLLNDEKKTQEIPKMNSWQRKDLAELVSKLSFSENNGFSYECQASVFIAEEMKLEKIAVVNSDGSVLAASLITGKESTPESNAPIENSIEILSAHYEKMGTSIKNKDSLARVIYYSEDSSRGVLVQSGASNVLDAAVIKEGKVTELIEIKELTKGAQMSATVVEVDEKGDVIRSSLTGKLKQVAEKVSSMNIKDAEGTNTVLDFGNPKNNRLIPLMNFVHQYQKKGATSLVYISDKGKVVNKISLTDSNAEIIKNLIKNKISAEVNMRANLNKNNANESDFKRLLSDDTLMKTKMEDVTSFKLSDIHPDKITKTGRNVRIGGFIVKSIKYDNYKENMDKEIEMKDLAAFKLVLTGKIMCNQTSVDILDLKRNESKEKRNSA